MRATEKLTDDTATSPFTHSDTCFIERTQCPVCTERSAKKIYACSYDSPPLSTYINEYYAPGRSNRIKQHTFELDRCPKCELVYQRYIGDEKFMAELYGEWLSTSGHFQAWQAMANSLLKAPESSRDGHELMWASHELGIKINNMKTLDYGMGWGLWAMTSKSLGANSFGYDLAADRMKIAEINGIRTIKPNEFPTKFFDFINTDQVFEHVPNPTELIKQLTESLKPGGILKICVPYGGDIEKRLTVGDFSAKKTSKNSLHAASPLEHINCFKAKTLAHLGRSSGLTIRHLSVLPQYAFLKHKNSLFGAGFANMAKELMRPLYRFSNRQELYVWLEKP